MNNSFYNISSVAFFVLKHGGKAIYEHKKNLPLEEISKNAYNFSKEILNHFKINVSVYGLEDLIPGPAIICPTHTSIIDVPALVYGIPGRKYFGAREEFYNIPIFGAGLVATGMPKINRSNKKQTMNSLDEAAKMIVKESCGRKKENTAYLVIYPEGTRTTDPNYKLLPFKKGAFNLSLESGLPIIPISSFGGIDIMPKGTFKIQKEKNRNYYLMIHSPVFSKTFAYEGISEENKKKAIEEMIEITKLKIGIGINFLKKRFGD